MGQPPQLVKINEHNKLIENLFIYKISNESLVHPNINFRNKYQILVHVFVETFYLQVSIKKKVIWIRFWNK